MKTTVNLLPDDLRRRAVRAHVIRIWTSILLAVSIVIAVMSHLRWMKCEDLAAQVENADTRFQIALGHLNAIEESEENLIRLKNEQLVLTELRTATSPLAMLQTVSHAVRQFSDQMKLVNLEVLSDSGQAAVPQSRVLTTVQETAELTRMPETIRVNIRGEAVSDAAVARFLNALRSSGAYQSVTLKSEGMGAGTVSGTLPGEFLIECRRTEAGP